MIATIHGVWLLFMACERLLTLQVWWSQSASKVAMLIAFKS